MSALWGMMACVLFTGSVIGWHLRGWRDRRREEPVASKAGPFNFDDR